MELAQHWRSSTLIIEDKGAGTALIQQLRSEQHGIPWPTAFMPKEDKLTRLHAQSARIEPGRVVLPRQASWLGDLKTELAAFPRGRHDDQVDSISQFLVWFFAQNSRKIRLVKIGGV